MERVDPVRAAVMVIPDHPRRSVGPTPGCVCRAVPHVTGYGSYSYTEKP